jgi:hypothetical protein
MTPNTVNNVVPLILKRVYRPPWWLPKGAEIHWHCVEHAAAGAWVIHGDYIHELGLHPKNKSAKATITERDVAICRHDGEVVDMIYYRMKEILRALRPTDAPNDVMIDLAMQAFQHADALEVLTDALLEDGTLESPEGSLWATPEVIRGFMNQQAKIWAVKHIQERWGSQRQGDGSDP